jgi:polyisoprenoid-binding protein YceI
MIGHTLIRALVIVIIGGPASVRAQNLPAGARDATTRLDIAQGTKASYRVREQLLGFNFPNDAVGTTQAVSGHLLLGADGVVSSGSKLTVDLRTLKSDDERRDNYLRDRTLQTGRFPLAEFVPRRIAGVTLPLPTSGKAAVQIIGDMTVHGVTSELSWSVDATFTADRVTGQAKTSFPFSKFGLTLPRLPGLLSVDDNIRLELDLLLRKAIGIG